jgi:hypothetical protein
VGLPEGRSDQRRRGIVQAFDPVGRQEAAVWRVALMVVAGLAGFAVLVVLAWAESEADDGRNREAELRELLDRARERAAISGRDWPGSGGRRP